jgi:DnaK suppressor protein
MRTPENERREPLRQRRERLVRTVATTDEDLRALEGHVAGSADDASVSTATALLGRLESRERRELEEAFAAEGRIADGTFGRCEGCRGRIPSARLQALPETRHCVTCQAREEVRA